MWKYGQNIIFQSTLPQGKWLSLFIVDRRGSQFQSTLPQGKWQKLSHNNFPYKAFQSTLPQGKWPPRYPSFYWTDTISIHTSTREVTGTKTQMKITEKISIHTSTREVTLTLNQIKKVIENFNPHFHKGSDLSAVIFAMFSSIFQSTLPQGKWRSGEVMIDSDKKISIHTSTREVTELLLKCWWLKQISIHTSTREVTNF